MLARIERVKYEDFDREMGVFGDPDYCIERVQALRREYGLPYISAMPTNLYGPNDNFDLQNSHVLPALIRRFDEARSAGASSLSIRASFR